MDGPGTMDTAGGPRQGLFRPVLPERLARLINPTVLAQRQAAIDEWQHDQARDRVRRRQLAAVIANHLLEE